MAPFNPEIQRTNDPTYGQNSRAIDTPDGIRPQGVQGNTILPEGQKIGDRSAEYEGQAQAFEAQGEASKTKAYGDLFANVVGIGDFLGKAGVQLVKKDIENKVYEIASNERSAYTAELEKLKQQVGVGNIVGSSSGPTNADGEPIPEAVTELSGTLATLKSARDGGKITKTDYWGRLAQAAQEMRAQYPGFKAEIDAEFSKVTGQNPANARVNGLISEINRAVATQGSQQNKTLNYLRQNQQVPGADQLLIDYAQGKVTDAEVYKKIGQYVQKYEALRVRGLERNERTGTAEERQTQSKADADAGLGLAVSSSVDKFATKYGFATAGDSEELKKMQDAGQISAQQWAKRGDELNTEITRLRVDMMQGLKRTGVIKDLKGGQKEASELVEAALQPMKDMHDAIMKQDTGRLFSAKREATAILDDNKVAMLRDSKVGPFMSTTKTISDLGGDAYTQQWVAKEIYSKNGVADNVRDWMQGWGAEFRAQQNESKGKGVTTYNDFVQEMTAKGITDPVQQKKIVQQRVNDVEEITDPKTPDSVKLNIAKAAFSPGNNGFLSKLNMDSFDERGRPINGMNAVFQKWTSPEISREMERLGRTNPQAWKQYTDWVKTTWATELMPREMKDLSKFQKDPNIKISWDTENKRFIVERTQVPQLQGKYRESLGGEGMNTAERVANDQQFQTVSRALNRINSSLYNLRHVAAAENPRDPTATDAFFLRAVADSVSPEVIKNLNSLPADLMTKVLLGNEMARKNANRNR